ncbi:I78 family peptidase inhibitor [Paracraurococcus lichenis]|uniref:I78 family peptidase inhibitor n=1 Tax=Paracraurococcus lichenis TaxID=3064888 RepID=A0ABT9E5S2_9PROT|nr:I78 family peptidase inhibitor [Paracraurococcus sp. LOR1-02]MDO9711516.1 I78 family peptidase inhibitor [Paracraurococcus sp. LOR1-02]
MALRAGLARLGPARAWLAAALILAAAVAAAEAQTAGPPGTGGCAAHQAGLAALAGLTEQEAIAAMERMPGIRTARVAGPGQPMTRDYRPERATILLRDGRVERVICG